MRTRPWATVARDDADLRQGPAQRGHPGDHAGAGARNRADDADRDRARWHRDPGRDPRLPRRRQDRHRAQGQRRRLRAQVRRRFSPAWCRSTSRASRWWWWSTIRPSGTAITAAWSPAPVFQQRHGRRVAADGRAAGRHRHLAGGAGRGRGEAQRQPRRRSDTDATDDGADGCRTTRRTGAARNDAARCCCRNCCRMSPAFPPTWPSPGWCRTAARCVPAMRSSRSPASARTDLNFVDAGEARRRRRDPVRAAGAGGHARAGGCDRGAGPARAPGRARRPLPRPRHRRR